MTKQLPSLLSVAGLVGCIEAASTGKMVSLR
jgi:hypothetical protein